MFSLFFKTLSIPAHPLTPLDPPTRFAYKALELKSSERHFAPLYARTHKWHLIGIHLMTSSSCQTRMMTTSDSIFDWQPTEF